MSSRESNDLSPTETSAPLRRARVACTSCHSRRVKCDASESRPCWHCRVRKTPCELIQSKRGKYLRRKSGKSAPSRAGEQTAPQDRLSPTAAHTESAVYETSRQLPSAGSPKPHDDNVITSDEEYGDNRGQEDSLVPEEGPEMLFARMAETEPAQDTPGGQTQASSRSYYLGDSFSLAYIVKTVCSPSGGEADVVKVHYPIPPTIADRPIPAHGKPREEPLPFRDAFITPAKDVSDELVHIFFVCIHPAYPVFDRRVFTTLYQLGQIEDLVTRAGYADRATARKTHYLRAKALYDADYENDRVILVAVLFLLGFWWAGPEDQKDTWHWLGSAISLAQTLGMHRSTVQSGMTRRQQSLWKRIWWSIYVREKQAAASLGRPSRIRDEDCDIEILTEIDMQVDDGYDKTIISVQKNFHVFYVVEMSKLAVILGRILTGQFSPRRNAIVNYDPQASADELARWDTALPHELRCMPVDETLDAPFWAAMLHAYYNNCKILLFRPTSIEPHSPWELKGYSMARMAADSTTRIAEDLLASRTMSYGQLHLVPALFAALSIHAIVIRGKDPIHRQLAENRSRQCMLGLSELAKSWPVGGWILRLFVNLMSRLTGQGFPFDNNGISSQHIDSGGAEPSLGNAPDPSGGIVTPTSVRRFDLDPQQHQQQQQTYLAQQAADQVISDALWMGNGFEFDYLSQYMQGPFLSAPFEGMSVSGEHDITRF